MREAAAQPTVGEADLPFLRRHYSGVVTLSLLAADTLSIGLGFFLAHRLRRLIPLPEPAQGISSFWEFMPLLGIQLVAIGLCFFFGRMYHRRRTRVGTDELASIFSGVSIGTLISIAVASFLLKGASFDYSRGMVVYAWLVTIVLVLAFRGLQARVQRLLQTRGYGRARVVIVGGGDPAIAVAQRLMQNPRLGYDVLGLVPYAPHATATALPGMRNLGTLDVLSDMVGARAVDEVIVAVPEASDEDILGVISRCDRNSISIKIYPDVFQIMAGQMSIGELGGLPLLNVRDVSLRGWKLTLKRVMDIFISATFLVFASPLLLFVAFIIKIDSPGPVFFVQERMGLDGKRFNIVKYRSMRRDAERMGTWTTKDDPRRTALGSFLRAKNIDELPQFINVLLGDMSVVGPRPEQPRYVEEFRALIPRYMERHREKCGITGWAQINGLRGDTSIEERTKYDLWYIENWSVWLDMQIILRTAINTVTGRDENAY